MDIVVSVDMEGATGIVSDKERTEGAFDYEKGRQYLTRDVNAAVDGAIAGGADRVVLHDSHGLDHRNILFEKVHPAAEVVRGLPILFFENLTPNFDACFLVALHSSYDETEGVLNHLFSSMHFRSVRVNGRPVSEGEISAALAGHFDIPTVLVTGDDRTCAEMKRIIPEIETAEVKRAISKHAALCLPFAKTEPLIRDAAKRAVEKTKEGRIAPYKYVGENLVEVELRTPYQAKVISELTRAGLRNRTTVLFSAQDAVEIYRWLRLILYLAHSPLIP